MQPLAIDALPLRCSSLFSAFCDVRSIQGFYYQIQGYKDVVKPPNTLTFLSLTQLIVKLLLLFKFLLANAHWQTLNINCQGFPQGHSQKLVSSLDPPPGLYTHSYRRPVVIFTATMFGRSPKPSKPSDKFQTPSQNPNSTATNPFSNTGDNLVFKVQTKGLYIHAYV